MEPPNQELESQQLRRAAAIASLSLSLYFFFLAFGLLLAHSSLYFTFFSKSQLSASSPEIKNRPVKPLNKLNYLEQIKL